MMKTIGVPVCMLLVMNFISYRISPIEVGLYKLSVCVSSVHNAPVYSLYNTRERKENKKKRKDECLMPVRLIE